MTTHMRTLLSLVIACGLAASLCSPAGAKDSLRWTLDKKDGQPNLTGMSTEEEADTEFWALCKGGGQAEIGVGANSIVGKGDGATVSLTLKSADRAATLKGNSRNSENSEMTGGTELHAQVKLDDPLFAVLATGKPVTVAGDIETPGTWPVSGLKAKVAAFLAACKK